MYARSTERSIKYLSNGILYMQNDQELRVLEPMQVYAFWPKSSETSDINISVLYKLTCSQILTEEIYINGASKQALGKARGTICS